MTREEALKAAREIHGWLMTEWEKEALETLIPELKESEDERIIKTLQEYVKSRNWNLGGPTQDEVLAWLEKQKEKTVEIDEIIRKARSEGRQEVIDNPEYYQLIKPEEMQKPGDNETEVQKAYREGMNAGRKEVFDHPEYYGLQLRRMYDYETGERNPEWSEKDEKTINELCDIIVSNAKNGYLGGCYAPDLIEKLKSLHHQPKQEWSEEDEKVRKWLLEYFYLHRDDLRGASVTSMEVLSFLDKHPGNGKACDVDEFSLTLRNCLSADSELTDEQADTFARAYGEDLYKVAIGEMKSGADRYDIEEYRNETKFDPKPGEKFWVRCKTNKTENLWFDKDDERPAYAVNANGIITYIVHIKKDGTGNCGSYQDKEKFLETFDILESKR